MSRLLRTLSIPAALALTGNAAQAGGPVGPQSDMLGINLTMTADQARAVIAKDYPGAKITDLPVQIGTPQYKRVTTSGFWADITGKEDQATNEQRAAQVTREFEARKAVGLGSSPIMSRPGDYGHDFIYVQVNPNEGATDIFGVSRYKEFSKQRPVTPAALLDSFAGKYGPFALTDKTSSYTWLAPGIREVAKKLNLTCALPYGGGFLYEEPKSLFDSTVNQRFPTAGQQFISSNFVNALNKVANAMNAPNVDVSKCGTLLNLNLTLSNDQSYVTQLGVILIDLQKGVGEVRQLLADVNSHSDAIKQEQLQKASQNKPRL